MADGLDPGSDFTGAETKKDDKKQRVIEAAKACFVESGFHGARMAQIAKRAQMSPGLIYHYFASKEEIIGAIVQDHLEGKKAVQSEIQATSGPFVDAFLARIDAGFEQATDPFFSALTLEITAEASRNAQIAELVREADGEIRQMLMSGISRGEKVSELEARAEVFLAIMQGLGMRTVRHPDMDREAVFALLTRMIRVLFSPDIDRCRHDDGLKTSSTHPQSE